VAAIGFSGDTGDTAVTYRGNINTTYLDMRDVLFPELPHARCAPGSGEKIDENDFFVTKKGAEKRREKTRRFCRECPEQIPCLIWALEHNEEGIWGGFDTRQRNKLRRDARRRKVPFTVLLSTDLSLD
jgi:hypothetical protein